MILKILVAAATAPCGSRCPAAPAFAGTPAPPGDIHCSCQPVIQQFMPNLDVLVEQGIKKGFDSTAPGTIVFYGILHS